MKYFMSFALMIVVIALMAFKTTTRTITGRVTDPKGTAISFASVTIKGTNAATATDADGKYSITTTKENTVLVFTYVGFKDKEVKVGKSDVVNVSMELQTSGLDEIVVKGYTAQRKHDISGAVSGVNVKSMSVANGLTGSVAGMQVGGSAVKLRGTFNFATPRQEQLNDTRIAYADSIDLSRYNANFNTEGYDHIIENPYLKVNDNPLSTFSIDVDAASYSNVRRIIHEGALPPAGAVRIEELVNYFSYQYPQPAGNDPFSVNTEIAACPWNSTHRLALIGLQGKIIPNETLPASNLVFLIDVSGSMYSDDKLPLVKQSLNLLVDQLRPQDKVSLVVYAGNAGLVLPPTSGEDKRKIKEAINQLEAGGSTAGGAGIQLAYKTAQDNLVKGGNNRVILCTDGDFNVGLSSDDALETLIEKERQSGVFLTVLGYGTGNYQDAKMQKLADKGNGNHAYIDGINEAKKVLINEFGGTLFTIAKDVKLQVEFNPAQVKGYRLIGYENRMLAKEDFNNDKKDAGELGSGHTVTALYEIIPAGVNDPALDSVDALRYQKTNKQKIVKAYGTELMNVKLRYKQPDGDNSVLMEHPVMDEQLAINKTSDNFRFAASVAEFGLLLRNSKYKGSADFDMVLSLAQHATGIDKEGYRKEFLQLVESASSLKDNAKVKKVAGEPVASY